MTVAHLVKISSRYNIHKNLKLNHSLCQLNPSRTLKLYFHKILFNIIFIFKPSSPHVLFSLCFPFRLKMYVHFSYLIHPIPLDFSTLIFGEGFEL
jgi:hypothetical protein